jgi:L-fucose isomerase-like protein
MRLTYKVDGVEQEVVVEHTGSDVLAWEEETGKSALTDDTSILMKTWIAHHAAVAQGQINGDLKEFEAFKKVFLDAEGVRDEGPTGPTGRGRGSRKTPGASSSAG